MDSMSIITCLLAGNFSVHLNSFHLSGLFQGILPTHILETDLRGSQQYGFFHFHLPHTFYNPPPSKPYAYFLWNQHCGVSVIYCKGIFFPQKQQYCYSQLTYRGQTLNFANKDLHIFHTQPIPAAFSIISTLMGLWNTET